MPPPEIVGALQAYTRHRNASMRARIAVPLIRDVGELNTSIDTLYAVRVDTAEEAPLVEAITALARAAGNPRERGIVFQMWRAIDPQDVKSWEGLVDNVLLAIAGENSSSFDLVRSHLELVRRAPDEVRDGIVAGLRETVPEKIDTRAKEGGRDDKRAKALERSLGDIGLIEKKRGRGIGPLRFGG
jgi:hypothetical protein